MSSDTEQALVKGFKNDSFNGVIIGAFRHRQPSLHVSKRDVVHPNQPIDLHVATTLEIDEDTIDKYNLKSYIESEDGYKLDLRVGIEEKKCNGTCKRMRRAVKEDRHQQFIDFCMLNALVPIYCVSFPYDRNIKPTPRNTKFLPVCVKTRDEFQKGYFEEDAYKFEGGKKDDNFLEVFLDVYLKNYEYWRDRFDEISVRE